MENLLPATRRETSVEPGDGNSKPPKRRENAFDQLVLPSGHKDMVKSLIIQHFRDKESGDMEQTYIVRGKGTPPDISYSVDAWWLSNTNLGIYLPVH